MPVFCSAHGCNNRRSIDTRSRGITFHKFPNDPGLRRQWEGAIRREGFVATKSAKLCSEHFKPDDFDRTGQIVRLRDGPTPSVFTSPLRLQKPVVTMDTKALRNAKRKAKRKAKRSLSVDLSQPHDDHSYALPSSPTHLKARLSDALAQVESLEREIQNAKARERRARETVKSISQTLPADVQRVVVIKEEVPWSSSVDQQDPEPVHIKEEEPWSSQEGEQPDGREETDFTKFPFTVVIVKSEDDDEKPPFSQLLQVKTEDSRETEPPTSSSAELMKTEADGEDCGGPEPAGTPDPNPHLRPNTDEEAPDSSETEYSDDDADWQEPLSDSMDSQIRDKPFDCDVCAKGFKHQCELRRHQIIHTGEKPYVCGVCSKRFSQQGNLKRHMSFHTGENPFGCDVCGYRFNEKVLLKKHMRVHTGESPNRCDSCGKDFKYPSDLKKHMSVHTKEAPFQCDECGKSFKYSCDLKKHTRVHSGKTPFHCDLCDKRFTYGSSFKKHLSAHLHKKQFG
ncbi:uncharacterized protein PAE49_001059 [Odontesthes bonariensis]|uniref:uncharacterized protein LOC142373596 n=1 Tax=Odontesthes bonariensis TaxID=219752 RepID=UPI003F58EADE